jgi:hypothetical protein
MNEDESECISITDPSSKKTKRFKAKAAKESFKMLSEDEEAITAIEDTIKNTKPSTTRFQKEVQTVVDETYKSFRDGLKKTILRSLGFSDRWSSNSWEVDHCNGRMNEISSHVKHLTEGFFRTIKSDTLDKLLSENEKQKLANAVKKEVEGQVDSFMKNYVRRSVEEIIKSKTDSLISSMVQEEVDKYSKEIQDVVSKEMSTKLEL